MRHRWIGLWGSVCALALTLAWGLHAQQAGKPSHASGSMHHAESTASVKITMEELHRHGGVPPGWRFSLPPGDPMAGRGVFTKLECYQCHGIQGETFPQTAPQAGKSGPELTGMGGHHPAEYFAESILNPNRIIVIGPGFTDADGQSIMPEYRDSLTVTELIDLVAYLKSLGGEHAQMPGMAHAQHGEQLTVLDQVVGDYRIHLVYHGAMAEGPEHGMLGMQGMPSHGKPGHGSNAGSMAQTSPKNHLMAFITDDTTGAPVPYLPVTATIKAPKQSPRKVKLEPIMGDQGFHYGADVTLPSQPAKITLSIGATTMRVMPSAAGSYAKPQRVSLDWTPQQPAGHGMSGHAPGQ